MNFDVVDFNVTKPTINFAHWGSFPKGKPVYGSVIGPIGVEKSKNTK